MDNRISVEGNTNLHILDEANTPLVASRLAAIVDSSFDAIISKDLNGIITTWNRAAERFFGYAAEEIIGKNIRTLIPESHQNEEDVIIARVRAGEIVESFETLRVRKDGSLIPVSITVSPIKDEHGRIVGASKIARDVTAARDNERRIRLLLREVNHRVKNQYAVILSIIRETAKRAENVDDFQLQINDRIASLASSHDLLVAAEWKGGDIAALIHEQLKPFGHEGMIAISGVPIQLAPHAVLHIGMAIHELGTNSAKYGVLGQSKGKISVSWNVEKHEDTEYLKLRWSETNLGVEKDLDQGNNGFGHVVLQRATPLALGGTAKLTGDKDERVWELLAPIQECVLEPMEDD
ncbi:PAS domain S-box protein [Phyllobacterium sp. OV277]|uniref:PAS domain S-box protein n=1 Tax=Phyllobacterium sp. OV277 TaxID=1882772 RepID=UPI00087EB073|nr:PAS domain S-box protein [Phyllobacterium sp. OV277]SDP71619.1 PAS domain S-box-containing protein [Phyllobacterium sp. OV277]